MCDGDDADALHIALDGILKSSRFHDCENEDVGSAEGKDVESANQLVGLARGVAALRERTKALVERAQAYLKARLQSLPLVREVHSGVAALATGIEALEAESKQLRMGGSCSHGADKGKRCKACFSKWDRLSGPFAGMPDGVEVADHLFRLLEAAQRGPKSGKRRKVPGRLGVGAIAAKLDQITQALGDADSDLRDANKELHALRKQLDVMVKRAPGAREELRPDAITKAKGSTSSSSTSTSVLRRPEERSAERTTHAQVPAAATATTAMATAAATAMLPMMPPPALSLALAPATAIQYRHVQLRVGLLTFEAYLLPPEADTRVTAQRKAALRAMLGLHSSETQIVSTVKTVADLVACLPYFVEKSTTRPPASSRLSDPVQVIGELQERAPLLDADHVSSLQPAEEDDDTLIIELTLSQARAQGKGKGKGKGKRKGQAQGQGQAQARARGKALPPWLSLREVYERLGSTATRWGHARRYAPLLDDKVRAATHGAVSARLRAIDTRNARDGDSGGGGGDSNTLDVSALALTDAHMLQLAAAVACCSSYAPASASSPSCAQSAKSADSRLGGSLRALDVSHNGLRSAAPLAHLVLSLPRLASLDLSHTALPAEALAGVLDALAGSRAKTSLARLRLRGCALLRTDCRCAGGRTAQQQACQERNAVASAAALALCTALQRCAELTELDLAGAVRLGDHARCAHRADVEVAVQHVVAGLRAAVAGGLVRALLGDWTLGRARHAASLIGALHLPAATVGMPAVGTLAVGNGNPTVGSRGAAGSGKLELLDLRGWRTASAEGACALRDQLALLAQSPAQLPPLPPLAPQLAPGTGLSGLRALCLRDAAPTAVGSAAVGALAALLDEGRALAGLRVLDVCGCGLRGPAVCALLRACAAGGARLQQLLLCGNPEACVGGDTEQVTAALCEALASPKSALRQLRARDIGVGDWARFFERVAADGLRAHTKLRELELGAAVDVPPPVGAQRLAVAALLGAVASQHGAHAHSLRRLRLWQPHAFTDDFDSLQGCRHAPPPAFERFAREGAGLEEDAEDGTVACYVWARRKRTAMDVCFPKL